MPTQPSTPQSGENTSALGFLTARVSRYRFLCVSSIAIRARKNARDTRRNLHEFAETAARQQVLNDVDQAWAAYNSALSIAAGYNSHYVAESERVRANLEFSYRHGGTTLLDYLDALRDYRQVHLDALAANQNVWLSIHQLSFAAATEILP